MHTGWHKGGLLPEAALSHDSYFHLSQGHLGYVATWAALSRS